MNVKLFTIDGLLVTFLHTLIFLGVFAAYSWFRVDFLGDDMRLDVGPKQSTRR